MAGLEQQKDALQCIAWRRVGLSVLHCIVLHCTVLYTFPAQRTHMHTSPPPPLCSTRTGGFLSAGTNFRLFQLFNSVLILLFTTSSIIQIAERMPFHQALYLVRSRLLGKLLQGCRVAWLLGCCLPAAGLQGSTGRCWAA